MDETAFSIPSQKTMIYAGLKLYFIPYTPSPTPQSLHRFVQIYEKEYTSENVFVSIKQHYSGFVLIR